MNLTPREKDKLLIAMAAIVARRRLERGVKLNHPEAVALISDFILEGARDGRTVAQLMEAGVPCSRVNDFKEVFDDPHVQARKVLEEVAHPTMGSVKSVRNPVLYDEGSPSIRRAAPLLAEHTAEILRELGYDEARITALAASGAVMLAK